ncbi:unnamed protein product, partial [Polarella glacialis]
RWSSWRCLPLGKEEVVQLVQSAFGTQLRPLEQLTLPDLQRAFNLQQRRHVYMMCDFARAMVSCVSNSGLDRETIQQVELLSCHLVQLLFVLCPDLVAESHGFLAACAAVTLSCKIASVPMELKNLPREGMSESDVLADIFRLQLVLMRILQFDLSRGGEEVLDQVKDICRGMAETDLSPHISRIDERARALAVMAHMGFAPLVVPSRAVALACVAIAARRFSHALPSPVIDGIIEATPQDRVNVHT